MTATEAIEKFGEMGWDAACFFCASGDFAICGDTDDNVRLGVFSDGQFVMVDLNETVAASLADHLKRCLDLVAAR